MKTRDFQRLAREQLRPLLPNFEVSDGLLFESPIGDLLRAFTFQPSPHDPAPFYLVSFVQPLYVPSDEEMPTFSDRSRRFPSVDAVDEIRSYVKGAGSSFLAGLKTPGDLAEWLERTEAGHKPDPFALEALAYSLLRGGRVQEAESRLDLTEKIAAGYVRADIDEGLYTKDEEHPLEPVLERVRLVREALGSSADDAVGLLDDWRELTARNLGLSDHLAPARSRGARHLHEA